METEDLQIGRRVHQGHNIKRTRIEKEVKQEALAQLMHLSHTPYYPLLHPGVEGVYTRVYKQPTPGCTACLHPGGGSCNVPQCHNIVAN